MMLRASFVAVALVLVGCAAASSPDAASSTAADTASDHAQHVAAIAEKQYGDQVDGVFGPFVRGESAVYRGTFAAHDNAGVLEGSDGVIASQPVVATLGVGDTGSYGPGSLALHIEAPAAQRHVDIVEAPTGQWAGTWVSMILFDNSNGGMLSRCNGCLPELSEKPATLSFANVEVDGHFYDAASTPFAITTTADLVKVPVAGITYADLDTTRAAFDFMPGGDGALIRHVEDIVDEPLPASPGMYACWTRTNYALDQWVSRTDITKYGVRDFKVESTATCCVAPNVCAGGGTCVPPTQSKSLTTGVGGEVTATTNDAIISADGHVKRTLTVTYGDHGHYFGTSDLHAVAVVHRQGMNGDAPITLKWSLAGGTGTVDLPDAAIITKVELAFSSIDGKRWDSNESRNYSISF